MKLTVEQIASVATGVVRTSEENSKVIFSRFTEEQVEMYQSVSVAEVRKFDERCLATAGVRLRFRTDSRTLTLAGEILPCTSRTFYSFDIFVNGKFHGAIDNFADVALPKDYSEFPLPQGKFRGTVDLGEGEKEVAVHFPWSAFPKISEVALDDGATLTPVKPAKKLLAFGDSITQGYDALRPSNRYASRLADALDAEEINKGIGGEVFRPALSALADDLAPDYITVAYGTNDFSKRTEADFKESCKGFFANLVKNYPNAKIFAITPIWRKDWQGEREFGDFKNVGADIRAICRELPGVTVIEGFDLVPKDENYYSDLRVHPRDEGFDFYVKNLYNEIKKYL